MTDKDRKMNELIDQLIQALCPAGTFDENVAQAEAIAEEIYQLGYDAGWDDRMAYADWMAKL
jgi:hypothetical protein